ncbi:MAG: zf-TFIIB domain-containing protein [Planctomycetota bacterium]
MKCGNDLLGYEECAVCAAGRGGVQTASRDAVSPDRPNLLRCKCSYCEGYLHTETWEDTQVMACGDCRGVFFPGNALEEVLNALRQTTETLEVSAVVADFKKRFSRKLPPSVRYRKCPVCDGPMKRHNYGTVSGVIVHVCGDHGTFVSESEFAGLADFIVRGGDQMAERAQKIHVRLTNRREGNGKVLDHLFGSRG